MRRFGLALVPVLICALTTQALGAMPANTIIMGDKAFDVSLLNDASMVTEILNAFIAAGNQFIYKTVSGSFISVMGQPVDPSTLPAVTYKDANKVAIQYSAGDSAATSTLGLAFGENVVSQGASKYILLPSNPAAGRPLGAIASVAGATLTYSSSNPSVATVSASGVVTGVSDGQASITVTASLAGYLTTTAQVLASVSHISAVTASNGRISVTLDGAPTVAPRNTDFAIIEVKSGTRVPSANLTLHSYDAATGVASLTVTPVTQWLTSIQYAVSYCSSVEWVTDSILAIPGVSSVTGTNGSVNVVLDWVPGADPVREDFVITKNVSSSSTWGGISSSDVRLASWNASTRTATLTFPVSPPTAVDQVFRYAASYRGGNAAQMTSWITVVGVVIPIEVGLQAYTSWANICVVKSADEWHLLLGSRSTVPAQLNISTVPSDATVTYSSSNPSVATVSAFGEVAGVNDGTAIITVTASKRDYTTTSKTVTVTVSTVSSVRILAEGRISITLTHPLPIEPAEYRNGIRCPTGFSIHGMMAFIDSVWGTGRWEYRSYEGTARMVSWDGTTAVVEVPIEPTSVSGQFICRFGSGREVESIVWRWPR